MRKSPQRRPAGFTLIELLVVIGIIVLLIGILIPAISGARTQAQKANTEAQLTGIDGAIKKYAAEFNGAVPGYYGTGLTTASGSKISGTQNLLLALSYSLGSSGVAVPGSGPVAWNNGSTSGTHNAPAADLTAPNGPTDYSVVPNKQQPAFYNPSSNDQKTVSTGFVISNVSGGWYTFPTIVDRFRDAMPILYFRRDLTSGSTWCSDTPSSPASYYRNENAEYLDGTISTANGSAYTQLWNGTTKKGSSYSTSAGGAANLAAAIQAAIGGSASSTSTRGDYILISAGADRTYGKKDGATTSDDIIRVG